MPRWNIRSMRSVLALQQAWASLAAWAARLAAFWALVATRLAFRAGGRPALGSAGFVQGLLGRGAHGVEVLLDKAHSRSSRQSARTATPTYRKFFFMDCKSPGDHNGFRMRKTAESFCRNVIALKLQNGAFFKSPFLNQAASQKTGLVRPRSGRGLAPLQIACI
jgi:hypothetical protein